MILRFLNYMYSLINRTLPEPTLLEERVPRGTLKGNSDCFIFGTLKGTPKNPMRGCFVKYPLMGVPLGTPRVL